MNTGTDIWASLSETVRRFVRSRVRDEHLADDLAQDVMLKAQVGLATAPTDDRLAAWLIQIARNTVIDFYRSPRSRGHVALEQVDEPPSPEAKSEATSCLTACLRPMVERLPEPYREAMDMTEYEGLSQSALADRLGISVSGVKSRVQRGREKLKAMLLDCCRIEVARGGRVTDCQRTERSGDYCGGTVT